MSARLPVAAGAAVALIALLGGCASGRHMPNIVQRPTTVPASDLASALSQARGMYGQREYGLAIGFFREAVRLSPEDARGYDGLAACYDMLGRFDLSRHYYELALAFAPTDARIYRNLAQSLQMQGRGEDAQAVLAEAAALPTIGTIPAAPRQQAAAEPTAPPAQVWSALPPAASVSIALDPALPFPMPDWTGRLLQRLIGAPSLALEPAIQAAGDAPPMLILNANGRTGLAASTRARFAGTAWQDARIANASPAPVSEIVYPSNQTALANAILTRIPFAMRLHPSRSTSWITIRLGADVTAERARG